MSSLVITHPSPANLRNDPSVQAWHVSISGIFGSLAVHNVGRRGRGKVLSTFSPSLISRPLSEASVNHLETLWRPESSSGCVGNKAFFGVPAGAVMTEISSRSLLLFSMGSAGGVSAARMASSPLAVPNVPATVLPIATVSLWKYSLHSVGRGMADGTDEDGARAPEWMSGSHGMRRRE
jgi:hypothetical protein